MVHRWPPSTHRLLWRPSTDDRAENGLSSPQLVCAPTQRSVFHHLAAIDHRDCFAVSHPKPTDKPLNEDGCPGRLLLSVAGPVAQTRNGRHVLPQQIPAV